MADDEHRRGAESNNFCALAHDESKQPCKQGYVTNCEAEAAGWGKYSQMQRIKDDKKKITKIEVVDRSFEAHHIAPVACVTEVVIEWDEKNSKEPSVITGTKWCINAQVNMIALPLWAHTIKYYCNNFDDLAEEVRDEIAKANQASVGQSGLAGLSEKARLAITSGVKDKVDPPLFKDLPQHNYGHTGRSPETGYNKEIVSRLNQITADVDAAKEEHDTAAINSLKGALDDLSKEMRDELKTRGTRAYKGTHQAWKEGMKKQDGDWYLSFSMAQEPSPMTFPLGSASGRMANKLVALARALF